MKHFFLAALVTVISQYIAAQTMDLKSLRKNELLPAGEKFAAATLTDESDTKKTSKELSEEEKKAFLQKNIPSIIGKSGMAPAFFDDINISFGDDKLSFTTGTFINKKKTRSFGGSLTAEAPNGSRTIFQPGGKTPFDFGLELKYTYEMRASKWLLLDGGKPTNKISSVSNKWFNFSFSSNLAKHILFTDDTLNNIKNPYTFEALVSFNYLFNSFVINRYINKRILYNIGAGFGRFTNYTEQDEVNLRKGAIYNNSQLSETEVISGRKAAGYEVLNGAIIRAAVYKPLTDPFAFSHIHLGATLSSFGLGSSTHLLNGTAGIYFSRWKSEEEEEKDGSKNKILKEVFSVGLIASFKNLQNSGDSKYMKDNFKFVLSAQIPLSFF